MSGWLYWTMGSMRNSGEGHSIRFKGLTSGDIRSSSHSSCRSQRTWSLQYTFNETVNIFRHSQFPFNKVWPSYLQSNFSFWFTQPFDFQNNPNTPSTADQTTRFQHHTKAGNLQRMAYRHSWAHTSQGNKYTTANFLYRGWMHTWHISAQRCTERTTRRIHL